MDEFSKSVWLQERVVTVLGGAAAALLAAASHGKQIALAQHCLESLHGMWLNFLFHNTKSNLKCTD